jgi:uroporphyrinogen III methyltransferase/synthase
VSGRVYLVGAGPGDPGLLTLAGRDALARADIVFYDFLANPRLLDFAPAHAERVLVGKRQGRATMEQADIERRIVEAALAGRTVVRLKGGDPFIFARGGEEAEACRAAGVAFEVIAGVTSAIAVPAAAGIPLTHREHASAVTFITGHPGTARADVDPDWQALVASGATLVFLMAMTRIDHIARSLMEAGMDPAMPAAAIRWGTTARQRSVRAPLSGLAEAVRRELVRPPVIFVIGRVAALADELAWFERRSLFGRRIVVTRARHQAGELAGALEALGAEVLEYPTIQVEALPVADDVLDRACRADWLVLTSANGVERFFDAMLAARRDLRDLAGVALAAIGPATARAIERRGLRVAAVPGEYRAEALLEALGDVAGRRIVLARAEVAREVLPEELVARGAEVEVAAIYRTVAPPAAMNAQALAAADMLTFTSSSTVHNFVAMAGDRGRQLLAAARVAAIGPITADTVRHYGGQVDVMPDEYTVAALVAAIEAFWQDPPGRT